MEHPLLSVVLVCTLAQHASQPTFAPPVFSGRQASVGASQPGPAAEPSDYVIGPDDVLGIVFWRETDLSGDVVVRPDGRITLPVIGEMMAAGLRPEQLQEQIQAAATKYINDPNVAVVVRTINSRKVFVTGRVTTPGTYDLKTAIRIMQAIALAGGLTEYADAKNITVLRTKSGQTQVLKFNYRDVAKGKNLDQNVLLLPGDTIIVP